MSIHFHAHFHCEGTYHSGVSSYLATDTIGGTVVNNLMYKGGYYRLVQLTVGIVQQEDVEKK